MRTRLSVLLAACLLAACGGDTNEASDAPASVPARVAVPLPEAYRDIDTGPGAQEARKCLICHTVIEGAPHSVGPNLHALFGRTVGTAPGFRYSQALSEADFVWTPEQLEQWLADPNGFMPGTQMTFPGVYDEALRHSVIAWLYEETGGSAEP